MPVIPIYAVKDIIADFGKYMCEQQKNIDYDGAVKDNDIEMIKYSKLAISKFEEDDGQYTG